MQSLSPTSRYLLALKEGSHQPDDVQQEAVSRLDTIYQELQNKPAPAPQSGGLRANSANCWVSANHRRGCGARPVYVGRRRARKTWLMDLFYQSLPGERKQRLHFHRFMLRVHEELTTLQGTAIRWRLSPTASKRKPTCSVSMSFCLRYYRCHAVGRPDESPVCPRHHAGGDLEYSAG
jgi:predicted ATPase